MKPSFLMYECSPELVEQAQKMQQWLIIMNRFFFALQNDLSFRMFTVALNIRTNKDFVWERKEFETIQISCHTRLK